MSDSSNPHLAVLQANQRRKDEEAAAAAAATQESEQRQQRQEDAARARETQEEVVQGHLNPHALIIARQAARRAEEERKEKEAAAEKERKAAERRAKQEAAQAAAAKEKEEETKRKTAEAKKAEPKLATHTGLLLVLEDKTKWSERLVELKDGENYPTLSFYAGATAEATFLREEVLIGGSVVVKAETSLPSNSSGVLTLSLRKEKPHPFAFAFAINRKVYTLEAHTEEDRDTWKRHLGLYAGKYHDPAAAAALATSDAADGDSEDKKKSGLSAGLQLANKFLTLRLKTPSPAVGSSTASKQSSTSATPKTSEDYQVSVDEEGVMNPFADDFVNTTFENGLFRE